MYTALKRRYLDCRVELRRIQLKRGRFTDWASNVALVIYGYVLVMIYLYFSHAHSNETKANAVLICTLIAGGLGAALTFHAFGWDNATRWLSLLGFGLLYYMLGLYLLFELITAL